LLEVSVALALGGVVVLTAALLGSVVSELSEGTRQFTETHSQLILARTELRDILRHTRTGTDTTRSFYGTGTQVVFRSECQVAGDWNAPCSIRLELAAGELRDSSRLQLTTSLDPTPRSLMFGRGARFLFLESAEHGGAWRTEWGPSVARPLAVGVASSDTVVLVVAGAR